MNENKLLNNDTKKTVRWLVYGTSDRAGILVHDILMESKMRLSYKGKEYVVDIKYNLPEDDIYNQKVWNCPYIVVDKNVYSLNEFIDVKKDYISGKQKVIDTDDSEFINRTS